MRTKLCVFFLTLTSLRAATPLSVPFFTQQKDGCGAASVAMVMHYWNSDPPSAIAVYTDLYNPTLHGIPLIEMKRYLESHGFRAFSMHSSTAELESHLKKGRPMIVALRKKASTPIHFAVLTGIDADEVLLNDPTRSKITRLKTSEFEKRWLQADHWMLLAVPVSAVPPAPRHAQR